MVVLFAKAFSQGAEATNNPPPDLQQPMDRQDCAKGCERGLKRLSTDSSIHTTEGQGYPPRKWTLGRSTVRTTANLGTERCILAMMSPRIALASWAVRLLAALGRWSSQGAGRLVLARRWTLGARRSHETRLRHPLGPLATRT